MGHEIERLDRLMEALKATPRTGWMLRGVPAAVAEPIAAHMTEAALIALVLGEKLRQRGVNVDVFYAASISVAHDTAEALIGDLVKHVTDELGKKLKEDLELRALRRYLGDSIVTDLVKKYILQDSIEAKLAKLSEQLATLLQGLRYYRQGYNVAEIICSMQDSIEQLLEDEPFILVRQELASFLER